MNTIWKFPLSKGAFSEIEMPVGATILNLDTQQSGPAGGKTPTLWALVDPAAPKEIRKFQVVGTGHEFNAKGLNYHGTFMDGHFVWHVFEVLG